MLRCVKGLEAMGMQVFSGEHQAATVSFLTGMDCEEGAAFLGDMGVALRAGLHCAPLAHESAGTLETGTVHVSFGADACDAQTRGLLREASKLAMRKC
jgi:selenocysteine lyase/cysteine desulfurase